MTAGARLRHRAIWIVLALALPALLVAAYRARTEPATNERLPDAVERFPDDLVPKARP